MCSGYHFSCGGIEKQRVLNRTKAGIDIQLLSSTWGDFVFYSVCFLVPLREHGLIDGQIVQVNILNIICVSMRVLIVDVSSFFFV